MSGPGTATEKTTARNGLNEKMGRPKKEKEKMSMKAKKVLAMLMASAMIMGTSVTAFAANSGTDHIVGTDDDMGTITVSGITPEEGIVVTAYKIVDATYDTNRNFTGYQARYDAITDFENIEQENLNSIIADIKSAEPTVPVESQDMNATDGGASYTAEVSMGTYLVMVEGADTKVYNPVVVSVSYQNEDGENVIDDGSFDVTTTIEDGSAWVKVSDVPTVEKVIDDGTDDGTKGNSADIGDIVNYDVTINPIPNYGGDHPVLNVVDTLSTGLDYVEDSLTVKIDGTALTADEDYKLTVDGQNITVDFVVGGSYTLNGYVGKEAVIEYQAKVTNAAVVNEDGNNNGVILNYTNDSKVTGNNGTDDDKTYTYTFDIDGDTTATDKVVTKVGEDQYADALPGAVFGLYTNENATVPYTSDIYTEGCTVTSDAEGQLYIKGLEAGTYYLKEISAPEGYSVNTHVFKIDITAAYNADGTLASWKYTIDNSDVRTITVSHEGGSVTAAPEEGGMDIQNTKLSALPSTGGIGTTIFTIGGCAIMVTAAGLYFATRKKTEK